MVNKAIWAKGLQQYLGAMAPVCTRACETRDLKGSFRPGSSSRQVRLVPELEEKEEGARKGLTQALVFPESKGGASWSQAIPG